MFNLEIDRDVYWRLMMLFCVASIILVSTDSAFAANTNDVIGETLCRVVAQLQGSIAKAIATIAVFVLGISLFMGKVNWGTAAMLACGIGVIFGAGQIVAWVSPSGGGQACNSAS